MFFLLFLFFFFFFFFFFFIFFFFFLGKFDSVNYRFTDGPIRAWIRPNTAWYTEELRDDKRLRRRLERKWRSNKQDYDNKQAYHEQCATVALRLYDAKTLQWAQKKSLHHIYQENIYTKVMFKLIYCKN